MIRLGIIIFSLLICDIAHCRPVDRDVAERDIPILKDLNERILEQGKLSAEDEKILGNYLNHDNRLVVSIAAWNIEVLGSDGLVFADKLRDMVESKPFGLSSTDAYITLALHAVENNRDNRSLDSLLGLPIEKNQYLKLEVARRLLLDGEFQEYGDQLLNEVHHSPDSGVRILADSYVRKRAIQKGESVDPGLPQPESSYHNLAYFIDQAGGLRVSGIFESQERSDSQSDSGSPNATTTVSKGDVILTQDNPVQETNTVVAKIDDVLPEPASQIVEEETSSPWRLVFPIIGVLLVALGLVLKFRKH